MFTGCTNIICSFDEYKDLIEEVPKFDFTEPFCEEEVIKEFCLNVQPTLVLNEQADIMLKTYETIQDKVNPNFVNWDYISSVPIQFKYYIKYNEYLNWEKVSEVVDFNSALVLRKNIVWNTFFYTHKLSEKELTNILQFGRIKFDWCVVLQTQQVPDYIVLSNLDSILSKDKELCIQMLCIHQKMSEDCMCELKDILDWDIVCCNQTISDAFIEEHKQYILRAGINPAEVRDLI